MAVAQKIIAMLLVFGTVGFVSAPLKAQRIHGPSYVTVEKLGKSQSGSERESPPNLTAPQVASSAQLGLAPNTVATAINTTVADIVRNPEGYDGRNVAVASEVEEIYSPWSIRLDERQLFAGGIDNDILVVAIEPLAFAGFQQAWKGKEVHVIGTVRILEGDDFRREYGRGIDDELFLKFAGKPVIIAQSIKPIE
jgi:hypothetical protein